MKCPKCNNEVSSEWKTCPFCEFKPKLCSNLGCSTGWLPKEAHFCPQCGSPVKGEENLLIKEIIEKAVAGVTQSNYSDPTTPSIDDNGLIFTFDDVQFKMVKVEGGSFLMGDSNVAKPVHRVTLNEYYLGETQVTQALWKAVMGDNPSYWKGDNLPVEHVSWEDCQEFVKQLNKNTNKVFRLPTEAEWEYAARGGRLSQGYKYAGGDDINKVAWYRENSENKTHPVKEKIANELGLYDMSGNVLEWCSDWLANYSSLAQLNPQGPSSSSMHVTRGGSWHNDDRDCHVANRYNKSCDFFSSDDRRCDIGFRLAISLQ